MTFAMNASTSSKIGRLNVGEQSPFKARAQARLERLNFFRRTIARNNQLLLRLVQRVEGVKELFLGLFLAFEKLDIVDQQYVDVPIAVAELDRLIVLDRDDEFVGELLARDVHDVGVRIARQHAVADRVHKMGFAEANPAVQKQWIIGHCGRFGHG